MLHGHVSLLLDTLRTSGLTQLVFPCVPDGDIYTGTVADFSGMDPIIYRESLQTEQYDSMSLNGEYSVQHFGVASPSFSSMSLNGEYPVHHFGVASPSFSSFGSYDFFFPTVVHKFFPLEPQ
jgi:hypothetical protein